MSFKIIGLSLILGVTFFLTQQSLADETGDDWKSWSDEESRINVSVVGNSVINMDSNDRLIRAYVDIQNFNPADGFYYMRIIQFPTNQIIAENEIIIREKGNGEAGADVAYMIDEDVIYANGTAILGDYSIEVFSEHGTSIGGTIFSIIKPSEPNYVATPENIESEELSSEVKEEIDDSSETELVEEATDLEPELENNQKIPDWIKNIFVLYSEGSITEDELISAIKFLIEEGIIEISL